MSAAPLLERLESRAARASRRAWPCSEFADSPVRFARDVLDRELWDQQARWVDACARPDARVSVVSGHKTGKTLGESVVALWAWATFSPVRVFLFAPKIEHIEKVALWKEIRSLYQNSGRCAACRAKEHAKCRHETGVWLCRPHEPGSRCSPIGDAALWNEDATTGLQSHDGRREIIAYTAREVDALGGLSGPKMIFIFDEAGGVKPAFFEAMKGNSAGGVTWVMAGNPLHTTGEQYDAHHSKRKLYSHVQEISSEDTPNVKSGMKLIPGLATRDWIELRAEDWGRDSTVFGVRVLGRYPKYEPGQLLRLDQLEASNARWYIAPFRGRLQIGVDVAFTGDEAVVAPRRGYKLSELIAFTDTDPDALATEVVGKARELREPHEQKPLIVYDAQGKTGRDFGAALRLYEDEIDIVPVYGNAKPRDAGRYLMRRDELAHDFASWVRRGGALPPDAKLEGEIARTVAKPVSKTDQRAAVPTNEELKKILGRSPDRRNACELACASVRTDVREEPPPLQVEPPAAAVKPKPRRDPKPQNDVMVEPGDESGWGDADRGLLAAWRRRS